MKGVKDLEAHTDFFGISDRGAFIIGINFGTEESGRIGHIADHPSPDGFQ